MALHEQLLGKPTRPPSTSSIDSQFMDASSSSLSALYPTHSVMRCGPAARSWLAPAAVGGATLVILAMVAASFDSGTSRAALSYEGRISTASRHEIALVNFIRHGERNQNPADTGLTAEGKLRAAYLGRCIGSSTEPSLAFPLGAPSTMLASVHQSPHPSSSPKFSTRPADTLQPIQDALQLSEGVQLAPALNFSSVERLVHRLTPGETLLVAWQHDYIPMLVNSLRPPAPKLIESFPLQCNSSHYEEPAYTLDDPGGYCYDLIWQVVLQRPQPRPGQEPKRWKAVSLNQLHQGFAPDTTECKEALAPIASDSGLFGRLLRPQRSTSS